MYFCSAKNDPWYRIFASKNTIIRFLKNGLPAIHLRNVMILSFLSIQMRPEEYLRIENSAIWLTISRKNR